MAAVDTPKKALRISFPPPTIASAGAPSASRMAEPAPQHGAIRIGEDGFIAEATVDGWVRSGAATRTGSLLSLHDGRRFLLRDALRVLGRRNGDTDPYGFTGRVEAIREFLRRGASVSADALRLGPAVYDIEYGVVAMPAEAGMRVM